MIKPKHAALLFAGLTLASCGSTPPTQFYTLAPVDSGAAHVDGRMIHVTLGQVNLPQILDRNNLVIRTSQDQIQVLQFDRWAAPLDDNIAATMTVDLEHLLPPGALIRSNGSPDDVAVGVIDLYIDRFDADAAGHVTFDVAWTVTAGNPQKTSLRHTEHLSESADNGSPAAIVAAMSRGVADLSAKIASELPSK